MEGEDLTLVCETSVSDSPVCWTKDGKPLRPSARCRLTYEGRRAQLVITETTLQDSGRYKCEAAGAWSSSIVRVHGEPGRGVLGSLQPLLTRLSPCSEKGGLQDALCPLCVGAGCPKAPSVHLYLQQFVHLTLPAVCLVSGFLLLLKVSLTLSWSSDQQSFFLFFLTSLLTLLCAYTTVSAFSWLGSSPSQVTWPGYQISQTGWLKRQTFVVS